MAHKDDPIRDYPQHLVESELGTLSAEDARELAREIVGTPHGPYEPKEEAIPQHTLSAAKRIIAEHAAALDKGERRGRLRPATSYTPVTEKIYVYITKEWVRDTDWIVSKFNGAEYETTPFVVYAVRMETDIEIAEAVANLFKAGPRPRFVGDEV